jgi:electron transfer flavoprotein alpha subunit
VFIEHDRGQVHRCQLGAAGRGRKLADKLGVRSAACCWAAPTSKLEDYAKEAFTYGADHCYIMRDPVLKGYRNEPFTKGLTDLVNKYQPEIMLLGATTMGRDLAGSVATTLGTGLTADCTELNIDGRRALAATRPTFGGSLLLHHHDAGLPPADGHGAPARDADAAADDSRSGESSSMTRWAWSRPTSSPSCWTSSPTPTATRSTWPMPTSSWPAARA